MTETQHPGTYVDHGDWELDGCGPQCFHRESKRTGLAERNAELVHALKAIGNLARLSGINGTDKDTLYQIQREVRRVVR
jgi:hypothetical protein